jgi:hypothetical protein
MRFSMIVKDIFNFQDGRIVFVGEIPGEINFIKTCACELFVGDNFFSIVHIEGEMIAEGRRRNLRSLSTLDKINITNLPYRNQNVWLKCNE